MSCESLISRRYLFAHKSQNAINIISAISAIGVLVATAAIIIVLSVFNGLNGLVAKLFGNFDPDIRIMAAEGKCFAADSAFRAAMLAVPGVEAWAEVVEDNALVRYGKRQMPATIMGVADNYGQVTSIDSIMVEGAFRPGECAVGAILADQLGVSSSVFVPSVVFYAPKRFGKVNIANPQSSFVERVGRVCGTFMVQQNDYDASYILTGVDLARGLLGYGDDEVTSVSVRVADGVRASGVVKDLEDELGSSFLVKDKWMQHESFFKMMEVEKLMAFAILLFIALIAAFNIIGSMSMLIFEKKESIETLRSMGLALIPTLFYTYTGVLGYHLLWADVAVFLLADLGMFALEFRLLGTHRCTSLWQQVLGLLVLWLLAFLFVYCTFRPPHLGLWRDPATGQFGLPL